MEEIPGTSLEEKRAEIKKIINDAYDLAIAGDLSIIDKIRDFGKTLKEKYGDKNFVLMHDLGGSTITKKQAMSYPFDTNDHEIERFIREKLII